MNVIGYMNDLFRTSGFEDPYGPLGVEMILGISEFRDSGFTSVLK